MAEYMVFPADALVHQVSDRLPGRACRLHRAAVLRVARGRAGRHRLRRRRGGRRLRPDRAGHGGRRGGQVAGPGDRPRPGRRTSSRSPAVRRRRSPSTSPTDDVVARDQRPDRRLRRRRLPGGHRPPVGRRPGPAAAAQARHLRGVQRLRRRRDRRLVDHLRRQGARRPRRPPRPALLAGRGPDARVRPAAAGPRSSPTSCRWPTSSRASTWSPTGPPRSRCRLLPPSALPDRPLRASAVSPRIPGKQALSPRNLMGTAPEFRVYVGNRGHARGRDARGCSSWSRRVIVSAVSWSWCSPWRRCCRHR